MRLITITTPDNVEVEYKLAGAGSRMAAAFVDLFIQSIIIILLIALPTAIEIQKNRGNINFLYENMNWVVSIMICLIYIVIFGYYIILEYFMGGKTLGKKLYKLRVIRENGMPVTFGAVLIRNLIKAFVDLFGIGLIAVLFSKKNKRLGDMAASTIVINESMGITAIKNISLKELQTPDAHLTNYAAVIEKFDQELIKDYLMRKHTLADQGASIFSSLKVYIAAKYNVIEDGIDDDYLKKLV